MDLEDKTTIVETTVLSAAPSPASGSSAYFVVIAGAEAGRMYKLDEPEMMIGRAMEGGIRIVDDGVSRRHAKVQRDSESRITVVDLGSTNGTYVNGDRVSQQILADGDKIQIGTTTILKFSYQDSVEEDFLRRQYESATRDVRSAWRCLRSCPGWRHQCPALHRNSVAQACWQAPTPPRSAPRRSKPARPSGENPPASARRRPP